MKRPGLRSKSKRQTLKQQHKVKKRVAQHHRKKQKEIKKGVAQNLGSRFTKRTRDPGIPTNTPFSDQILQDAIAWKANKETEKEEMKKTQKRWQQLQFKRKQMGFSSVEEMLEKAKDAQEKHKQNMLEKIENEDEFESKDKGKRQLQNFWRQVNSVIDTADIILHILDARDPEGTRCKQIEQTVTSKSKKLVLVLNKIDLIPTNSAKAWLKFYRSTTGPTFAFRANTQNQKSNLSQKTSSGKISKDVSGVDALIKILANYGRLESEDGSSKIRTAVTVGVVGLPNVGKSSIINTLKRNKSCRVGAEPGVTKSLQTIQIDSKVKLIDSPGVVVDLSKNGGSIGKILSHALNIGSVADSRVAAIEIIKRCGSIEKMAYFYQLPVSNEILNNNPDHFLAALAIRKGFLKKGAKPDLNQASRNLVKDWTSGKLSFHTMPPEYENMDDKKDAIKIQESMDEDFNLDALLNDENDAMEDNSEKYDNCMLFKVKQTDKIDYNVNLSQDSRKRKIEDKMDDDSNETKPIKNLEHFGQVPDYEADYNNLQCDDQLKKIKKKRKKLLKKSRIEMEAVGDDLSNMMSNV